MRTVAVSGVISSPVSVAVPSRYGMSTSDPTGPPGPVIQSHILKTHVWSLMAPVTSPSWSTARSVPGSLHQQSTMGSSVRSTVRPRSVPCSAVSSGRRRCAHLRGHRPEWT